MQLPMDGLVQYVVVVVVFLFFLGPVCTLPFPSFFYFFIFLLLDACLLLLLLFFSFFLLFSFDFLGRLRPIPFFFLDVIFFLDMIFFYKFGWFFLSFFCFNWALFFNNGIWINLYKHTLFIPSLFHSQPNKKVRN